MIHPNHANGDVLRRIEAQGDDYLGHAMSTSLLFLRTQVRQNNAEHFRELGHAVSVRETATEEGFLGM